MYTVHTHTTMQTSLLLILHVSQGLMDMSEVVWQERRMVRLAGEDIQVSGGSGGRQMVVQLYTATTVSSGLSQPERSS